MASTQAQLRGLKSWVSRKSKDLITLVKDHESKRRLASVSSVKYVLDEFDKQFDKYASLYLDSAAALNEEQFEIHMQEFYSFEEDVKASRFRAAELVDALTMPEPLPPNLPASGLFAPPSSAGALSTAGVAGGTAPSSQSHTLPRLSLPRFGGNPIEWTTFWERFTAAVDETDLPKVTKFTYLQSLLDGEASSCIRGLAVTAAHYDDACELLKKRFGRTERIIFSHLQALLTVSVPEGKLKAGTLRQLYDELQGHVRSLEALKVDGTTYGVVLTPLLVSRLPTSIRLEWSRDAEGHESDLQWLLNFLKQEIERRERCDTFAEPEAKAKGNSEKKKTSPATVSALHAGAAQTQCDLCSQDHPTDRCHQLKNKSPDDRFRRLKRAGLCFVCMTKGHMARDCTSRCEQCGGSHHRLCCKGQMTGGSTSNVEPVLSNAVNQQSVQTVLQTVKVLVNSGGRAVPATALLDSGSDRSYITKALVDRVKPRRLGSVKSHVSVFGSSEPSRERTCNVFECSLSNAQSSECFLLKCVEVPSICAPMQRRRVWVNDLRNLHPLMLADDYTADRCVTLDILIGLDAYHQVLKGETLYLTDSLVAQHSLFGWVLSGSVPGAPDPQPGLQLLCSDGISSSLIRSSWDLESIGLKDSLHEDDPSLTKFEETIRHDGVRYEVSLPWNGRQDQLKDNFASAEKRLFGLERRLRGSDLAGEYDAALDKFEAEGFVEEVTSRGGPISGPHFYMPHRPVVREDSSTTRIRPVFDASATDSSGLSLNDCLYAGPSLNPCLVDVLLRFRRWSVALTADISKAFLQIKVRPEDRDVHRYLRRGADGVLRVLRFERVPFGNKASPFLLNATVHHHLQLQQPSVVVEELKSNLYVDDWLSGADTEDQAQRMFVEAREIMLAAGMPLVKWGSNRQEFLASVCPESGLRTLPHSGKILGVLWSEKTDCFHFDGAYVPNDVMPTKRIVLSAIARLFDPLGLMTPFVTRAKIVFQEAWRLGLEWDAPLPDPLASVFSNWLEDLVQLRGWRIPRRLSVDLAWSDLGDVEVHTFCDASEKAFGAAVYLSYRTDAGRHVSLIISRARVAPLKRVTLPRLELIGALVASRLSKTVCTALKIPDEVPRFFWTDSMVALGWIRGDASRWKQFVANRVQEIQDVTDPMSWRHCPGLLNPADLLTRGVSAAVLMSSPVWLRGPDIDHLMTLAEPVDISAVVCSLPDLCLSAGDCSPPDPVIDLNRFSCLQKAYAARAWVQRFVDNCHLPLSERVFGALSTHELCRAELAVLRDVQHTAFYSELALLRNGSTVSKKSPIWKLTPYIDDNGLLRVRGRLDRSQLSFEARHPLILPKGHFSLLFVRFLHVQLKHAGVSEMMAHVRATHWIVGLRCIVKRVKRECLRCQRFDSRECNQTCAPLPAGRVNPAPPFSIVGVDFAGPLYCEDVPGRKYYICLFTCAVVRAVHLELTPSLSLDAFLQAFRRFCARRGCPSHVYSDNASTFKGADTLIRKVMAHSAPEWHFIVPGSPWWGGFWERLVRSVKTALRKSVGGAHLSHAELETVLQEIESCINSRPLTHVDSDLVLTPAHFLTGRLGYVKLNLAPSPSLHVMGEDLEQLHLAREKCLNVFWTKWTNEYLKGLPHLVSRFKRHGAPKIGSIVLIKEDNVPRFRWPLGVIEDIFPGRDGLVRALRIRTQTGVYTRPLQKVFDLEMCCAPKDVPPSELQGESVELQARSDDSQTTRFFRPRRTIRPPDRLDL